LYNTNLFISPDGSILGKRSKVNLYSQLGEDTIFTPGDGFSVCKTSFGNAGVMICYEGDFPETPAFKTDGGAYPLSYCSL
jgi:aliphatic nitrilase